MNNEIVSSTIRTLRTPSTWPKLALWVILGGVIYWAYFQPLGGRGASAYSWLTGHWATVSNYSHGWLIPFMAIGLAWWKHAQLRAVEIVPSPSGFLVVAAATFIYYVGVKSVQLHTVVASFVILLYGLTIALGGWALFRILFFPITFLFLMIPLNFLDEVVGFPLRVLVANAATGTLNLIGIHAYRTGPQGTAIYSTVFNFDVADPCSGIRSLMALTTVTAAYAYVTQHALWKRWFLFLCSMPLAVLGNLTRVLSIALVAQVYGQEAANKFHDNGSGYIIFTVAIVAMVAIGILLNFNYRRLVEHWMKPLP